MSNETRAGALLKKHHDELPLSEAKTHKELVDHFSSQFVKTVKNKEATSHYVSFAFYQMQAINMGMDVRESNTWANAEMERLKEITLDRL